jgi:hypothetical protein
VTAQAAVVDLAVIKDLVVMHDQVDQGTQAVLVQVITLVLVVANTSAVVGRTLAAAVVNQTLKNSIIITEDIL